jgi:Pyridine nucleotide-disulphide oxidoreductase, dimerisation domain/3-hydroxyacyl-CoA dehydrogenase, C-terminal domain/3-hydroxyacyl-CoA dehydrogenase, NAD binding domain
LIPLVEIAGGAKTSEDTIRRASEFYTAMGKRTVRLHKEVPGHVANRLQSALAREVYYLVAEGVVSVADVDTALCWVCVGASWGKFFVVIAVVTFDSTTRTIIDGRMAGFCKLIVDRKTSKILGCHVVGERAVDIVQVAAIAIAGGMRVDGLAAIPLSFPTYEGILVNAAASAALQLGLIVYSPKRSLAYSSRRMQNKMPAQAQTGTAL